jgi:CspA family cold shock protein
MPKVKYIASPTDMPADQRYVLVKYGEEYGQTRQPLGFTITVARQQSNSISELSFLTAVHTAKGIAKKEGLADLPSRGDRREHRKAAGLAAGLLIKCQSDRQPRLVAAGALVVAAFRNDAPNPAGVLPVPPNPMLDSVRASGYHGISTRRDCAMASGTVKWFNATKGYGFIQPTGGGKDVFVHISAVERAGLSTLNEGQQIQYEEVANKGKTSAENLKVK